MSNCIQRQHQSDDVRDSSVMLALDQIKIRNFKFWENAQQQQFINNMNMPFETRVDRMISEELKGGQGEVLSINKRV